MPARPATYRSRAQKHDFVPRNKIVHDALGTAVPLGRLLESAHDHVRALGVVDAVADDVA